MRHLAAGFALGAVLIASPLVAQSGLKTGSLATPTPQPTPPPAKLEVLPLNVSATTSALPVGTEADIYCTGWIDAEEVPFTGTITAAEKQDSQHSFIEGDVLYLDVGAETGVAPGQMFWVVRPAELVYKWGSVTNTLGRYYETPARIRIICAQERSSIAEIVANCSDVALGDRILPFEPIPVPLVRRGRARTSCDTPNGKATGHIVRIFDSATPAMVESVVYLDLGEAEGLQPGDFLTVFRDREDVGLRSILGEVGILKTSATTAVGKVTWMHDTMGAGDRVEIK